VSDFALPADWVFSTLKDVADIVSGMGFPKHLQGKAEGEFPVFKVGDISSVWKVGKTTLVKSPNNLSREEVVKIKGKVHPQCTIIFAKIGEALRLNRRAILGQPSLIDNNVMGLIPKTEVVDRKYLFYFMTTVELGDLSRATAVPSVRKSDVQNIKFPLAPMDQQKRIVAEIEKQFSRLDEAVANLKRAKANLKRYKAAVLKAAVEGKLTEEWRKKHPDVEPADKLLERILAERREKWQGRGKYKEPAAPDTTDLPELPEGWMWTSAAQLAEHIVDGTHHTPTYVEQGIDFISAKDVADWKTDFSRCRKIPMEEHEDLTKRCCPKPGHVLVTKSGTIGRVAVVKTEKPFSLFESVAVIPLIRPVSPEFVGYAIFSTIQGEFGRKWQKGVAVRHLHLEDLRRLPVPLPPLTEQVKVVEEFERLNTVAENIESTIEAEFVRAVRLRQSILKQAFSGQLVSHGSNHEPASVLLERIRANSDLYRQGTCHP
jgi:type I restriction enzyme S subunit